MPIEYPLSENDRQTIGGTQFPQLQARTFKGGLPVFSATPTYQGTEGETVLVDTGSSRQICAYLDGDWKCGDLGGGGSKVRVYLSADQAIAGGDTDKLVFDTEDFDTNDEFDSTTNYRFTAKVAGYYFINCKVYDANDNNSFIIRIYKNGANYSASRNLTTGYSWFISDIAYLNGTTDYIEIYVNALGAKTIDGGGADATNLTIHKI